MRLRMRWLGVVVAVLVSGACGDATGLDPDDLAGTWNVTGAYAVNVVDASERQDLIALGMTMTMVLDEDGSVSVTIDDGQTVEVETGTLAVEGGELMLRLDGDLLRGSISRDGDFMTMDLINGIEWDFDDNGVDIPATLSLELERVG